MEITDEFIAMEKEVMDKLLAGQDDRLVILRDQYSRAEIQKREFSGAGFFTTFDVPANVVKLESFKSIQIGDVVAEIVGVKDSVGFVLFVKEGVIHFLEGYVYGDESWPKRIDKYKVIYLSGKERDMRKVQDKLD